MASTLSSRDSLLIIIAVITVLASSGLYMGNSYWTSLFILSFGVAGLIVVGTSDYYILDDTVGSCHYNLNDIRGCPDPNGYCEDNFTTNYDDCYAWCNYACPLNSTNPGICPKNNTCDNGTECTFENHKQSACESVVCNNELFQYETGVIKNLSPTCQLYCASGAGRGNDKCIEWYCQSFIGDPETEPRCDEYCETPENELTLLCFSLECAFPGATSERCACYPNIDDDECTEFCEKDNNIEDEAICKSWLCEVYNPTDKRCLLPCSEINGNENECEYREFTQKPVYIENVYNSEFLSINPQTQRIITSNKNIEVFELDEKITEGRSALLINFYNQMNFRLVGTQYFEAIRHNITPPPPETKIYEFFILENTGIAETFYIKTNDYFVVAENERLAQKYLTLGCGGVSLDFHNSTRELQQWRFLTTVTQ